MSSLTLTCAMLMKGKEAVDWPKAGRQLLPEAVATSGADAGGSQLHTLVLRGACQCALPSALWGHMPRRCVVTASSYATGVALPANAGITSSANRRSERSACAWDKVPQANAQIM